MTFFRNPFSRAVQAWKIGIQPLRPRFSHTPMFLLLRVYEEKSSGCAL
jgi:hypothetical protein